MAAQIKISASTPERAPSSADAFIGRHRLDRRAAWPPRVGPVLGDQSTVPGQHGRRGDQAMAAQHHGQPADQPSTQKTVGPLELQFRVGPAQDLVLMAKDEQLGVQAGAASSEQGQPSENPAEHEVHQPYRHGGSRSRGSSEGHHFSLLNEHARVFVPHRMPSRRYGVWCGWRDGR